MKQSPSSGVPLRTYRPGDEGAFYRLNEEWICQYFAALEPADREILSDPRKHILDGGGQICMAEQDGAAIGCCALIATEPGEFEVAKMTVAEPSRGNGVGQRLLRFVVQVARQMGARRLYLESSTKVAAAIHLYERSGFRHLPGPQHPSKYARADVFMEMRL